MRSDPKLITVFAEVIESTAIFTSKAVETASFLVSFNNRELYMEQSCKFSFRAGNETEVNNLRSGKC